MPKKRLSSNCEKVIKIKLRIICRPYAYLQSIIKTSVKFQKNQNKIVGGVAHTRYPLSIHFLCQNDRKMTKFKLQTKVIKINLSIISKPHAYLQSLVNTFTAADDCSRFYRSLPPTTVVVLRVYRYVPGYR